MTPELTALLERLEVERHTPVPEYARIVLARSLVDSEEACSRRRAILADAIGAHLEIVHDEVAS